MSTRAVSRVKTRARRCVWIWVVFFVLCRYIVRRLQSGLLAGRLRWGEVGGRGTQTFRGYGLVNLCYSCYSWLFV